MLTRSSTKRTRAAAKKESESDPDAEFEAASSEEEEQYEPPKKRQRRSSMNSNTKNAAEAADIDDDDDDVSSGGDSESEDEENGNSHSTVSAYKALEKENKELKAEVKRLNKELASVRKQTSKVSTPARNSSKKAVNEKKKFQQFQKALIRTAKLKKTRFYGCSSDIEVEQTMDIDDFKTLFDGKGHKIQPTPQNKPKSVKSIIEFNGWQRVKELFEAYDVALEQTIKVSLWRQGGLRCGKSFYRGPGDAKIDSLTVEHNRSSQKLKLTFSASQDMDEYGF